MEQSDFVDPSPTKQDNRVGGLVFVLVSRWSQQKREKTLTL